LDVFHLYFDYQNIFFELVCERGWSAAAQFHRASMKALDLRQTTLETTCSRQSNAHQQATVNFALLAGSCPAHPTKPHSSATCNLRMEKPV
jgi:hypothetical protein